MGILDWFFGKKVVIEGRDHTGKPFSKAVSERQFKRWEASGALRKTAAVEVHVIDPKGNYTAIWEIGKDISHDVVQQARDAESGALYAVTTYEAGEPKTVVCLKDQWLKIKEHFDAIDNNAAVSTKRIARRSFKAFANRRQESQAFDEEKAIRDILLNLSRCKGNVIVGSAKLDEAFSCNFFVGVPALEKWLSAKVANGEFRHPEAKATAKAFVLWLQAADILQPRASGIPSAFYKCIKADVTELVNTQVANVHCKECNEIYSEVNVEQVELDDTDIYISWRTIWSCPHGHILYNKFHELHVSPAD